MESGSATSVSIGSASPLRFIDLGGHRFGFFEIVLGNHHARAGQGKGFGEGAADPLPGPGDDGDPAGKCGGGGGLGFGFGHDARTFCHCRA